MGEAWYILGSLGIGIAGWFIGLEIKRMRNQIDQLQENLTKMALQIARLEAKMK